MIPRRRPRGLGRRDEEKTQAPSEQTAEPTEQEDEGPNAVWSTLQQSIGNAAVSRLRRTRSRAQAETPEQVDDETQKRIDASKGKGEPLPPSVRSELEPALGDDLDDVRVHTDSASAQIVTQLGKRAFTQGNDVFFAEGVFKPESQRGRETLTHELTHVSEGSAEHGAVLGEDIDEDEELLKLENSPLDEGTMVTGTTAQQASTGTVRARSREEAVERVPEHVEPKRCFVWYVNNREGWDAIPGTGCAHWVAHEMGIKRGVHCDEGFSVRVSNVTAGKTPVVMSNVKTGDIWVNPVDASHCGIVRQVNRDDSGVVSVEVEHDSSRQGRVVTSTFSAGSFFR